MLGFDEGQQSNDAINKNINKTVKQEAQQKLMDYQPSEGNNVGAGCNKAPKVIEVDEKYNQLSQRISPDIRIHDELPIDSQVAGPKEDVPKRQPDTVLDYISAPDLQG